MKFSNFLRLLQTLVIVVLVFKVVDLSNQLQLLTATNHSTAASNLSAASYQNTRSLNSPTQQQVDPDSQTDASVNKRMTHLIQTEFARLHASIAMLQADAETVSDEFVDPQLLEIQAAQLDRVDQDLDRYINEGVLSEKKMELLLAEIAQLEVTERRNMMRKLVKAMNSGQIDAHF